MKSDQINELAAALAKAQGEMKGATKDSSNPFFKSKYADLASVWEACRSPLSKNGLCVIQSLSGDVDAVRVVTILAHSSGQWIQSELPIKPVKNDPQSMGSSITYGRRYALMAMVGIAPEDDDGNEASGRSPMRMEQPDPGNGIYDPNKKYESPKRDPEKQIKKARPFDANESARAEVTAELTKAYRPFFVKFSDVKMNELLMERYGVAETKLMTVDQLGDLLSYMESMLEKVS